MKILFVSLLILISCSHHKKPKQELTVVQMCESEFNKTKLSDGGRIIISSRQLSRTWGKRIGPN